MTQLCLDKWAEQKNLNAHEADYWNYIETGLGKKAYRFDRENPHVYELFVRFSRQALGRGHRRLGAKSIIERMRWEITIESTDLDFKINNNYAPYYSRKLMAEFPQFKDFFQTREAIN